MQTGYVYIHCILPVCSVYNLDIQKTCWLHSHPNKAPANPIWVYFCWIITSHVISSRPLLWCFAVSTAGIMRYHQAEQCVVLHDGIACFACRSSEYECVILCTFTMQTNRDTLVKTLSQWVSLKCAFSDHDISYKLDLERRFLYSTVVCHGWYCTWRYSVEMWPMVMRYIFCGRLIHIVILNMDNKDKKQENHKQMTTEYAQDLALLVYTWFGC